MASQGYIVPLHEPAEQPKHGRELPSTEKFNRLFAKNPQWHDTGCKYHPSCLECPEVRCIFDNPTAHGIGWKYSEKIEARHEEMRGLLRNGHGVWDIARMMGCGYRTVLRIKSQMLAAAAQ